MKNYFVKTPWWLKRMYPQRLWSIDTTDKIIYLSFDDGPHPVITSFILDQLALYQAKASFFCIGKNVEAYPAVFQRIVEEGHAIGNHTQHHLNGWKTSDRAYLDDIRTASQHIASGLFRPPYGRMKSTQAKKISEATGNPQTKIVMWDVLSGDFDQQLSREKCLANVIKHTKQGSVVVFHDSEKAWEKMSFALPQILSHFKKRGYSFDRIVG